MAKRPVNDNQPQSDNDNQITAAMQATPANDETKSKENVNKTALASMAASLAYAAFNVSNFSSADNDGEAEKTLRELDEAKRKANREAGLARMQENNRKLREAAIARRQDPNQMNLFDKTDDKT